MIEALNILETYEHLPPFGSATYAHELADAFQRAFIDRNGKLGDPAFVNVPVDQPHRQSIRAAACGHDLGRPRDTHEPAHHGAARGSADDALLGGRCGRQRGGDHHDAQRPVWIRRLRREAGFFLNNEMDDFAARPGLPNQFGLVEGPQNAIAPGKRMLSAMSPTIVLDPRGPLLLVVGARGGPRIITSTAQVILNAIDSTWVSRTHWPRRGFTTRPSPIRCATTAMAWRRWFAILWPRWATCSGGGASGTCTAVMRVAGGLAGAVDPRSTGGAAGY